MERVSPGLRGRPGGRPSACEPESVAGDPADFDVLVFCGGGSQRLAAAFFAGPVEQPPGGTLANPRVGSVSSRASRAWKARGSVSARPIISSSSARDRSVAATSSSNSGPGDSSETSAPTGPRGPSGSRGCPAPPGSRAARSCGTPAAPVWRPARPACRPQASRRAAPGPGCGDPTASRQTRS